ncbi:MAG: hypothetical protein CMP20_11305 [Rickettsiales bacterium]|nr:hypothetical protein [Rickettsiales bacterium]
MKIKIIVTIFIVLTFLCYHFIIRSQTPSSEVEIIEQDRLSENTPVRAPAVPNSHYREAKSCADNLAKLQNNHDYSVCINNVLTHLEESSIKIKVQSIEPIYVAWTEFEWQSALAHMLKLPIELRDSVLNVVVYVIGCYDLQGLLNWVNEKELDENLQIALITAGYSSYVDASPISAIEDAKYLETADIKSAVIDNLLVHWSIQDVPAVMEWITQQPRPDMYEHLVVPMLKALTDKDITRSEELILSLTDSQLKYDAVAYFTQTLAREDSDSAFDWVMTLPEGSTKQAAVLKLVDFMVVEDTEFSKAIDLAIAENDANFRDELLRNLANNLPNDSLETLTGMTKSLPVSARKTVIGTLAKRLVDSDPYNAKIWLNSLPPSEETSLAQRVIGEGILMNNLPDALAIANNMYDSPERSQLIEAAFLFAKSSDSVDYHFLFERLALTSREISQFESKYKEN